MLATSARYEVLGVRVDAVTVDEAVERVLCAAGSGGDGYVCVTGTHGVVEATRDAHLTEVHNASLLTVPDGQPIATCGRALGLPARQIRGVDLTRAVLAGAENRGIRTLFLGSTPPVLERLARSVQSHHPRLDFSVRPLPFRPLDEDEVDALGADLAGQGVRLVFLGLSTPKQELLASRLVQRQFGVVILCVGAAFDFLAGTQREAPRWLRPLHLEWAYRVSREPRRLFPRYLVVIPAFLLGVLRDRPRLLR